MTSTRLSPDDAYRYVISGHGQFTLVGREHSFTYRTNQVQDENGKYSPIFISSLECDKFEYIGFLPLSNLPALIAGRKGRPNSPAFKALAWWLRAYIKHLPAIQEVEFWRDLP